MKRLIMMFAACAMVSGSAAYADYGMAGCGLGSMAFKEKGQWQQVLAATTNGTFGTQTFGISSGTSNCTQDGVVKKEAEQEVFVAMNYDTLSGDLARGEGETLVAFSSLLGCIDTSHFASTTKDNYDAHLSQAANPSELLSAVKGVIAADVSLSQTCS